MYFEKGIIKDSQDRKIASETEITVRHADDPSDKPSSILHSVLEFVDDLDGPAKDLKGMVSFRCRSSPCLCADDAAGEGLLRCRW